MTTFNVGDIVKIIGSYSIPIPEGVFVFPSEALFRIESIDIENKIAHIVGSNEKAPLGGPYSVSIGKLALVDE